MSTSDPRGGEMETPGAQLDQGDPYRTPAEVGASAKRGWLSSPVTWFLTAGVLAGVVVTIALARRADVPEYVEEFGMTRAGPPIEVIEEQMYEEAYAAPSPAPVP